MDTPQSRVVNLTSLVEPNGTIEWTDIGYACDCILMHVCNFQMLPQAWRNLLAQNINNVICNLCMLYISWHHDFCYSVFAHVWHPAAHAYLLWLLSVLVGQQDYQSTLS